MALIVLRPEGLNWNGETYPSGEQLPPAVAAEISKHPNYKGMLAGHYIAADGSDEAVKHGFPGEMTEDPRIQELEVRVDDLETRLAALEAKGPDGEAEPKPAKKK